jgi:hypothetical protein
MLYLFALNTLVGCSEECSQLADFTLPVPQIVSRGGRYPELIPQEAHQATKGKGHSQFDCSRCGAAVISGAYKDRWLQSCRCSFVVFLKVESRFTTVAQWAEWQAIYDKESANPLPVDGSSKMDPSTGLPKMTQNIHDWLSRKKGFPTGIQHNLDGTITAGEATMSIGPLGTVTTYDKDDREGTAKAVEVLKQINRQSEPPRYVICSGIDPDYVWPPTTDLESIKREPFRCSSCNAWVKSAKLVELPCHDKVMVCLCHSFMIRKDVQSPANYGQWRDLITMSKQARFEHHSKLQQGQS